MKPGTGRAEARPVSSMHHWRDYIESDPLILFGKPIFKGTRITVESVLDIGKGELGNGSLDQLEARLKRLGLGLEHFSVALHYRMEQETPPDRRA